MQAGQEGGLARRTRELAVPIVTFVASFVAFSVGFGDWRFGLGFVLLILVHELGHVFEARRQGLRVTLPTFIPGFGAYVRHELNPSPWRNTLISLAGPLAGGLGAAAVWALGSARDSHLLVELAYFGFLLNAANLVPVGFLDGGAAWHSISETWRRPRIRYEDGVPVEASAPERNRAVQLMILYAVLAVVLVGCVLATRHSRAF
ncbi:MAG TPA: site-2 protease family protein [Gaiellaceae bacterium]|jgi:Zn-dependent protease|nr:site-2 protease family protein [Gaiellaceae bacterium]